MKKRVVISVTNDLVSDQRVHKVATSLQSNGFDVLLIGRKLKNSIEISGREYKTKRIKLLFNKGFLFYAEYNFRLFFILLFTKAHILLSNDLDTLFANYLASKFKNGELVYDSHEYFTEVPELVHREKVKRIWEVIELRILPKIKNAYTVCDSIANIYNEKYKVDFKVIRNLPLRTLNLKLEKSPFPRDKKIIIYQGALNLGRGIEKMISAMQYLENYFFVIIGDGDIANELKDLINEKNLKSKVQFLGKIPFKELNNYTPYAHLGISIEDNLGLNYYYALPNKLFDYIQAQVPVLVSDFPEMKAIVENYNVGILYNDESPQALAQKIEAFLNDSDRYRLSKENLATASDKLVWENEESKLLEIFKNI